jgi:hypothetical protein
MLKEREDGEGNENKYTSQKEIKNKQGGRKIRLFEAEVNHE